MRADAAQDRAHADALDQIGLEEGAEAEGDLEPGFFADDRDLDVELAQPLHRFVVVAARLGRYVQGAADHGVRAVPDGGELIGGACVLVRVVPAVGRQRHAHRGQELVVGDVLLLRDDHRAGDLEPVLGRQGFR
jgi:hypothetical protein